MIENDIVLLLRNKGFEQGTKHALLRLAEEINDLKKVNKEVAEVIATLASVVTLSNKAMDGMDEKIRKMENRDDNPESVRGHLDQ